MDDLIVRLKMRSTTIAILVSLMWAISSPAAIQLWTHETFHRAYKKSPSVVVAKVTKKSRAFFHKGIEIEEPTRAQMAEFIKDGVMPMVETTVTIEVVSLQKGNELEIGSEVVISWRDHVYSMCVAAENYAGKGVDRLWYKVGDTYKLFPEKVHRRIDGKLVGEELEQVVPPKSDRAGG